MPSMFHIHASQSFIVHAAPGACLAHFETGPPDINGGLAVVADPALERREDGCARLLSVRPGAGYYDEDRIGFRLTDPALRTRKEILVEVDFLDEGFGVIAARRLVDPSFKGTYIGAARAASHTRLNTGHYRMAAFLFSQAPDSDLESEMPDIVFTGLQNIRKARVMPPPPDAYWPRLQAQIPKKIVPAVSLERPLEVVCSAGIQVLGARDALAQSIDALREQMPLAKALGFNAIEAYVRWDVVEPEEGRFDWSFYDALIEELRRYDLKLFPLLIVGSAYALPEWFFKSSENVGFVCLEHGLGNPIQSIWSPYHRRHVTRFLQAFGKHYEPMGCLQGVRLGPSGNYGESQYPASGDWGHVGKSMHIHIGMWAGDTYAQEDFRRFLRAKYGDIETLRKAWGIEIASFDAVQAILPEHCLSKRQRIDLYTWYTDSMTDWCEWWAIEARNAMPNTPIYQSAGGWGAAEIGTDYSGQAKSMTKINGGIRLTNELDSFHQCYYATRLAATAARLYDIPLGFEPAMGHTARGTAGRLFNCISNNGSHFFTYGGNVFDHQTAIANWLKHYPLLDCRQNPVVDVALYYPQTMNFLSHDTFRYLNAWGFNNYAREIRNHIEVDYLDDRLIRDGFLSRYKVLAFAWGDQVERDVLETIDAWLRDGGTVIFPCFLYTNLTTIEGDAGTFSKWSQGDTGHGRFHRYRGDDEPPSLYAGFVKSVLLDHPNLSPLVRIALEAKRPEEVFLSAQQDGCLLILNFNDASAKVEHPEIGHIQIPPYGIARTAPVILSDISREEPR